MGVKKLHTFLEENNLILQHKEFKSFLINKRLNNPYYKFKNQLVVCIDFFIYVYKFNYSCENMLYGFVTQILKFLSNGIIPVYIIDGESTEHKEDTLNERRVKQNKLVERLEILKREINLVEEKLSKIQSTSCTDHFSEELEYLEKLLSLTTEEERIKKSIITITKDDIANIYKIFQVFKIPYIKAKGEADFLCAKLYTEGIVLTCLSSDTDLLPLGCGSVVQFKKGVLYEYDLDYILEKLQIDYIQFVDFCILLGCDYIKTLPNIDSKIAYIYIKKFKTIENIIRRTKFNKNNDNYCSFKNKYKIVRDIYIYSGSDEPLPTTFKPITPKLDKTLIINSLTSLSCIENKNCEFVVRKINMINRYRN